MRDIAAHIPHGRRHLARSPWRWLHVVQWLFAVGDDGILRSSRVQMETGRSHATAGKPDQTQLVDTLFQEYARTVLAYLVHRLPTLVDAEDALDDVFLAALHASASGQTLTCGWLMVTAQRRIADFYRRRERTPQMVPTVAAEKQYAVEHSEPEWVTLQGEEYRELMRLVARLPQQQQEVLALHFAAGLQSSEIGEIVGKRADAVRALLSRAMRRLREEWTR